MSNIIQLTSLSYGCLFAVIKERVGNVLQQRGAARHGNLRLRVSTDRA